MRTVRIRLFCSDTYGVYPLVLAVGGQQRHWTAALRRRSIVVFRSLAMPLAHPKDALPARQRRLAAVKGIERWVALFAHLHVNRKAAPEMYRLSIQTGRFFAIS
jgi:hypothetical protein